VKRKAGRLADLQRHIRRDLAVGPTPDAVGAKIPARTEGFREHSMPLARPSAVIPSRSDATGRDRG
jgi:hypothetical protein